MSISKKIKETIKKSSWIRKMFEQGAILKEKYGKENVFDFSIGNPYMDPPEVFQKALIEISNDQSRFIHSYMPNTGYPHVRKAVSEYISGEHDVEITENEVIMTCGAAGALNVIFKALLDPDDEVICPAPYFVEYSFYVDNHGGKLKTAFTNNDFSLDIKAIESEITEKTKAVLINSPNNPTGVVYSQENINELSLLLQEYSKKLNKIIYLISDEPYRKLVYDDIFVPSILKGYNNSIICTSYSKDISIPGERIGFLAVNSNAEYKDDLFNAMAITNRILGFVNAPALMQRIVPLIQGVCIDVSVYKRKRDLFYEGLTNCGYEIDKPAGAFYLFPKSPIADDIKFVSDLQEELILTVPGSGFGKPGYFRITYCSDDEIIIRSIKGFKKIIEKYKK